MSVPEGFTRSTAKRDAESSLLRPGIALALVIVVVGAAVFWRLSIAADRFRPKGGVTASLSFGLPFCAEGSETVFRPRVLDFLSVSGGAQSLACIPPEVQRCPAGMCPFDRTLTTAGKEFG